MSKGVGETQQHAHRPPALSEATSMAPWAPTSSAEVGVKCASMTRESHQRLFCQIQPRQKCAPEAGSQPGQCVGTMAFSS